MKSASKMYFAATLGIFLNGCVLGGVTEPELIGKYHADLPEGGSESLQLMPGGKCAQIIRLESGAIYEAQGSWKYDADRSRLFLTGIRQSVSRGQINPQIAQTPSSVTIGTRVSRTATGTVIFYLTEDIYYHKQ